MGRRLLQWPWGNARKGLVEGSDVTGGDQTAIVGQWGLGAGALRFGFDDWAGWDVTDWDGTCRKRTDIILGC